MEERKKKKEIQERLVNLRQAWACSAIEGLVVSVPDKKFIENLVKQGLDEEEIIKKIKGRLGYGEIQNSNPSFNPRD